MQYGAVVVWWLALLALGAVGLPIAATVLRPLPDRGGALALPAALVVLFLPVYWLGHLHYGPATVAVGALVLAGLSALCGRRSPEIDRQRAGEWAVVFSLGFLLVVGVRAADPSIVPAGGEKFLDYGLLTSIQTGSRLPPADFWFAGEPVAYYYGGHLIAATLATLTGTPTRLAYNLALAGVYGTLVGAAYGVGGSIAAARDRSYRVAGTLAAFFVGVAANVVTALQVILWALPEPVASGLARAVAQRTAFPADELLDPARFSYWSASRVIPGSINEFPFFAFLNGDLHAHMSSTPFLLLVVGLALAYTLTPAGAIRRRRLLVFGAIPPVAGTVAVVNTWSLPATAGVTGLAVLFADAPARDLLPPWLGDRLPSTGPARRELSRMATSLAVALGVALVGLLWTLPYLGVLTGGPDSRSIGLLPDRTGLLAFALVHGWFLAIYAGYLLARRDAIGPHRRIAAALAAVVLVGGLLLGAPAVALVLPLLGVAWYLLRRRPADVGFEAVLLVAGAGLVLLVEFVYLEEPASSGRLNTVFKTYAQVWLLWATGAGVALADRLPERPSFDSWRAGATTGLAALLVLAAATYGAFALVGHVQHAGEPTLDATQNARTYHAEEWRAIQFLESRPGQPTIVSAPACYCHGIDSLTPYSWVNAPSTFSGALTVAGWSHAADYHGQATYDRRLADVRVIYTGNASARGRLLDRYGVEYVYVGPNERTLYGEVDLGDAPGLEVAFENDAVTIYAVRAAGG